MPQAVIGCFVRFNHINTDSTLIQEFSCDEFVWGDVYTQSGVYTNTYTNIAGCDSVVILDLTILTHLNLIYKHIVIVILEWRDV